MSHDARRSFIPAAGHDWLLPFYDPVQWLLGGDGPHGFTVDQDCELRSEQNERSTVRYTNHALDTREIRDHIARRNLPRVGLDVLSMGMSHDFEVAIAEGSTCVRLGTAIFGERPKNK